jgi:hypothetical protein
LRKWQLAAVVVGLLAVVYAVNVVSQHQQEKRAELEKAAKEARTAAEAKHTGTVKGTPGVAHKSRPGTPAAFALPGSSGPADAPVKVEVFLDLTNSCHEANLVLKALAKVYGKQVRLTWLDMSQPAVSMRADKLALGCNAGLTVNGKVNMVLDTPKGKRVVAFRGPIDSGKFLTSDVYSAINTVLNRKGLKVPALAVEQAARVSTPTRPGPGGPSHPPDPSHLPAPPKPPMAPLPPSGAGAG